MLLDSLVSFIPINTPLALTTGTINSSPVIDLLGSGEGTAPANIIGNASLFGANAGIGLIKPMMEVLVTTTFVGGTSVQVKYQGAPDTAGTHLAGSYTTIAETPAIVTASLTAGTRIALWDFFPDVPENLNPRYLRLSFVIVGTFSAGAVVAPVTLGRDDYSEKFAPSNFVVA